MERSPSSRRASKKRKQLKLDTRDERLPFDDALRRILSATKPKLAKIKNR